MRRIWIGAALLCALAGCQERDGQQALGSERRGNERGQEHQAPDGKPVIDGRQEAQTQGRGTKLQGSQPQPTLGQATEGQGAQGAAGTADREKLETARVLATLQVMNQAEMELSRLVEQRGASPEVKQYARRLLSDHQLAMDQVNQLAARKGIDLALAKDDPFVAAHTTMARDMRDRLSKLSGQDFDMAYMGAQPEQHTMFTSIAQQGGQLSNDPEIDAAFTQLGTTAHGHHGSALAMIPRACGGDMTGAMPGQQGMGGTAPGTGQPGVGPGMGQGPANPGTTQPGGSGRGTTAPEGARPGTPAGSTPGTGTGMPSTGQGTTR